MKTTQLLIALIGIILFSSCQDDLDKQELDLSKLTADKLKEVVEFVNSLENYQVIDYSISEKLDILGRPLPSNTAKKKIKAYQDSNFRLIGDAPGEEIDYWILDRDMIDGCLRRNVISRYKGLALYPCEDTVKISGNDHVFHSLILQPIKELELNNDRTVKSHVLADPNSGIKLYNYVDPCPTQCDNSSNNLTK